MAGRLPRCSAVCGSCLLCCVVSSCCDIKSIIGAVSVNITIPALGVDAFAPLPLFFPYGSMAMSLLKCIHSRLGSLHVILAQTGVPRGTYCSSK